MTNNFKPRINSPEKLHSLKIKKDNINYYKPRYDFRENSTLLFYPTKRQKYYFYIYSLKLKRLRRFISFRYCQLSLKQIQNLRNWHSYYFQLMKAIKPTDYLNFLYD